MSSIFVVLYPETFGYRVKSLKLYYQQANDQLPQPNSPEVAVYFIGWYQEPEYNLFNESFQSPARDYIQVPSNVPETNIHFIGKYLPSKFNKFTYTSEDTLPGVQPPLPQVSPVSTDTIFIISDVDWY